jgi:hypothetical protein
MIAANGCYKRSGRESDKLLDLNLLDYVRKCAISVFLFILFFVIYVSFRIGIYGRPVSKYACDAPIYAEWNAFSDHIVFTLVILFLFSCIIL